MKDLKDLLQESIKLGYMSDALAVEAVHIAKSHIYRRQDIPEAAREDALGRFTLKLVEKWQKISPDKNPKSYIKSMAFTSLMDELRKHKRYYIEDKEILEKNNNDTDKNKLILFSNILKEAGITSGRQLTDKQRHVLKVEAVRLFKAGVSSRAIARDLGLGNKTISRWRIDYLKRGHWFFKQKPRGRPKSV